MIVSRLVPLAVRSAGTFKQVVANPQVRQFGTTGVKRGGHGEWVYRDLPKPVRKWEIWAEAAGAFMWWWVFWHLFTDYHHLIGHHKFPCVEDWTDEELGIPPDDADDP